MIRTPCWPVSKRCFVVFMCLLASIITYAQRMSFHMVLVDYATSDHILRMSSTDKLCNWSEMQQGIVLSAYYVGFAVGMFGCDELNSRWKLLIGVLLSSISTLTIAIIGGCGVWYISLLRYSTGLFSGLVNASFYSLITSWVFVPDRSWSFTMIATGSHIGTCIGSILGGSLTYHCSWDVALYVIGALGLIAFVILCFFIFDTPEKHPYIKGSELNLIRSHMGKARKTPPVPWSAVLSSAPFWGIMFGQFGHGWFIFIVNTVLPKYMYDVLGMQLDTIGYVQVIPWSMHFLCILALLPVSDWQISTPRFTRMLYTTLGCVPSAVLLILASLDNSNVWSFVMYISIAMTFKSADYPGVRSNMYDLTDTYASKLLVLANGASILAGILVPLLVAVMAPNKSLAEWQIFFWASAGIMAASNVLFCLLCSGDKQWWSK